MLCFLSGKSKDEMIAYTVDIWKLTKNRDWEIKWIVVHSYAWSSVFINSVLPRGLTHTYRVTIFPSYILSNLNLRQIEHINREMCQCICQFCTSWSELKIIVLVKVVFKNIGKNYTSYMVIKLKT